jgi:hypothetical protein
MRKNRDKDCVRSSLSYDHEEESVVDWVSPLIYDVYLEEKESLEKVNLSNNIENFVDKSSIHHVLTKSNATIFSCVTCVTLTIRLVIDYY